MLTSAVLVTVTILFVASALATLVSFTAQLHDTPLARVHPRKRILLAITLAILAIVGGIVTFQNTPTSTIPSPGDPPPRTTAQPEATVRAPNPPPATATLEARARPAPSRDVPTRTPEVPKSGARAQPTLQATDVRVIGDHPSPALQEYARALLANTGLSHTTAILTATTSEPDPGLQGLITANLTLQATFTHNGDSGRHALITVTARGGGFDADQARLQAQERLAQNLRDALARATAQGEL